MPDIEKLRANLRRANLLFQNHKKMAGDKIETVAKPIAKTIDAVLGTKLAGCGGCAKMKERLNAGMTLKDALLLRLREAAVKRVANVTKVTPDQTM